MRILVVGDSNSIFIKQYIEYVLLDDKSNKVVLLEENQTNPAYAAFYRENGVVLKHRVNEHNRLIARIPKIRSSLANYFWCKDVLKEYPGFDLVHVHGLNYSRGNIGQYMRKNAKKMVITVWGDELFRAKPKMLRDYRKYYDLADCITVATNKMWADFTRAYDGRYEKLLRMNKFALGVLDRIDAVKQDIQYREAACKEFGIQDPSKLLVFVGHNGRFAQRHVELSQYLQKLPKEQKDKITLVYTMTYGDGANSKAYMNELLKAAKETGCEFVVLREYLNEEKTAKLRSICDIMLHAQLTDAFSASICESLYSGSVILNGRWLEYSDLPNCHERFVEYDEIQQITEKLSDVISNFDAYKQRASGNAQVIRELCAIDITTAKWKESVF